MICPYCLADEAAFVSGHRRNPGDFGLCTECNQFFVFVEAGTRPLTPQEVEATANSPAAQKIKALHGAKRH